MIWKLKIKKGNENHVADQLYKLANEEVTLREIEVVDEFPDEKLLVVQERPWFANMVNFKVIGIQTNIFGMTPICSR